MLYECVILDDECNDEHTRYSKESIYTFNDFFFLTKSKINELLDGLGLVQELRFIVLEKKDSDNNINMTDTPYIIDLSTSNVNIDNDFWSILLKLPEEHPLEDWGRLIVKRLIGSGLDTRNGITLLADEPLGNKPMLNASRPTALR